MKTQVKSEVWPRIKVETLSNGSRLVRRYRNGKCYACVWSADTTDKQIASQMMIRDANFFPYNEATGEFIWAGSNVSFHFKR